ncbi:alpha-N-acetylglucosaminidase TIM-barrel domain-containing protein [Streptomyces albus]|uniref:alpha-N-acetylglucosaminidase n=1 Tax=Streptomyces albus TaxID=1888 RepID=UPI0024AE24EA|nr:alpha-N-acetylglucosaminidase TIM-barrel domain-containing protein [Streptomyces albus]MDI6407752.1 alpha-N-acetylglucosaminidase TIM-barrel domain-containing protein [Streptomyces albus]
MHEPLDAHRRYDEHHPSALPQARTPLGRRAVLGTTGALGAGLALGAGSPPAAAAGPSGGRAAAGPARAAKPAQVAAQAVRRLLPRHAGQFTFQEIGGPERFKVTGSAGRIRVAGTGPVAMLTGVHWYLKYSCDAHISWAGSRLDLPATLPAPRAQHAQRATVPHRFALNDTHDGYTAPYADWEHWERFCDVLALHGFNQVLVTAGQEAVYHRMLQDFGYSDADARAWIPAPSHQPWWLLQNMAEYGGPVSPALLKQRTELGRRIVDRLRELGMTPVLPGYFGTVPADFAKRNKGARTVPQGKWSGLDRPPWLDPRTAVFRKVAASFYRHQKQLFGDVTHFKMDLLHEGGDPGNVPVPQAARAVEKALHTARPGATWVILGWQSNPRKELLDGLAAKDKMLIVDGLSDLERVTDREKDWGGVPYAFGTIPNFGGRTTIGAKTHMWAERFTAWRDKAGSKLVGTCYMPEAAGRDAAALELFSELAWREQAVDRGRWFADYARLRYGGKDAKAAEAMKALRETAYRISSKDGRPHDSIFAARPSLTARSGAYYATHTPAFDLPAFDAAFTALLGVGRKLRGSDAYRHDLTDVGRQVLANRSWMLIGQLQDAYRKKDSATFKKLAALWLKLMDLADEMSGGHTSFLLGPWLAAARRAGSSAQESAALERTARVLITTWADRATADGGHLANYANRDWHGLIRDFHLPQWRAYLDDLQDALDQGRAPKKFDWYAQEEPWTRRTDDHPTRPAADPYAVATRVRDVLAKAPFQSSLKAVPEPRALGPGQSGTVRAVYRNENGLAPTGAVDLTLRGLDGAEPQDPTSHRAIEPGGTATVRWRVAAGDRALSRPLDAMEYTVEVLSGPAGQERVTTTRSDRVFRAGPLPAGVRTVTTNDAVFGHLSGRWAIDGAGADLWKGTAEFGAVYRERALADGGSVTLTVVSQEDSGPWARAGIIVRNRLAEASAGGFLNLAVTPGNGVVLSYDSDGDGTLDTYRRITGVRAPVTLRLSRSGGSFRGELSTDEGASWRTVATVEVPGASAQQDAGAFMTATNGGGDVRALAEFAGWETR